MSAFFPFPPMLAGESTSVSAETAVLINAHCLSLAQAIGAYEQAQANLDTMPDNEADANDLARSAAFWLQTARAWVPMHEQYAGLASQRAALATATKP